MGNGNALPQAITRGTVAYGAEKGLEHVAENRSLIVTIRTALREEGWKFSGNAIARTAARGARVAFGLHIFFAGLDGREDYKACMED